MSDFYTSHSKYRRSNFMDLKNNFTTRGDCTISNQYTVVSKVRNKAKLLKLGMIS